MAGAPSVFFLYRDSRLRRAALAAPLDDASRYSLYGLDELAARGFRVAHNLGPATEPRAAARLGGAALDRAVTLAGGYSGDFARVLASRRALDRADVVFSTVDTVGIPLVLLARWRVVQRPLVYAAIGLPERLARVRSRLARRAFRDAYRRVHTLIAYGAREVDELRAWLGAASRVEFVPFGVDTDAFRPEPAVTPTVDVVSIGADPRRDVHLLLAVARQMPERSFHLVASRDNAPPPGDVPSNVRLDVEVPFARIPRTLASARVVALPVHENSYSGATTTLLQGMASGKPVVVSRTGAIATGYHLDDGVNCRLSAPGDVDAFAGAVGELLADHARAQALGTCARETVEQHLSWGRYTRRLEELLLAAAGARAA